MPFIAITHPRYLVYICSPMFMLLKFTCLLSIFSFPSLSLVIYIDSPPSREVDQPIFQSYERTNWPIYRVFTAMLTLAEARIESR